MEYSGFAYLIVFIVIVCIYVLPYIFIFLVIKSIVNAIRRNLNHKYFKNNVVSNREYSHETNLKKKKYDGYVDVHKSKLSTFNTDDINTLKDYLYDIFFRFESAYNSLDYNIMKMLSTKQLYQNYHTGISLDLKVGKKRIIENIERKNVIIYELDSTTIKQVVSAMIEVSYINYVIDKDGNVISGNRVNPITEKFEVTFRKDFEKEEITKCPNCGANITGNKCDYCRTTLKNVEFKISDIKRIVEK